VFSYTLSGIHQLNQTKNSKKRERAEPFPFFVLHVASEPQ
jgi:hypothetical protein